MERETVRTEIIESLVSRRFKQEFREIASRYGMPRAYVLKMGMEIAQKEIIPNY